MKIVGMQFEVEPYRLLVRCFTVENHVNIILTKVSAQIAPLKGSWWLDLLEKHQRSTLLTVNCEMFY
jgi:hypothetical protein